MVVKILSSSKDVFEGVRRCCRVYDEAYVAVAWCGKPTKNPILKELCEFGKNLHITVGASFCGTSPEAIDLLIKKDSDIRVFDHGKGIFHPKVFLFIKGEKYALIVGSANLSAAAFSSNVEVCSLMSGTFDQAPHIRSLRKKLSQWHDDAHSFVPNEKWMKAYRLKADEAAEAVCACPKPPKQKPKPRKGKSRSKLPATHIIDDGHLAAGGVVTKKGAKIELRGKQLQFTGKFSFGSRAACRVASKRIGAKCPDSEGVTTLTDILIVGAKGSPNWSWDTHGEKIVKAAELQKRQKGLPWIITEATWVRELGRNDLVSMKSRKKKGRS